MPNPVKDLLEVYEDMLEVLLVLEIFLTENAKVEDLLCGAPSCSESCLFFSDDFASATDEAYCSVVLALLQVAFLGKCND